MTKALVLLSGGLDSTTCLYWAKQEFDEVHAISFDYGQRHSGELRYARENADRAGCKTYQIVHMEGTTGNSALTMAMLDVDQQHPLNHALPASFTPGRNAVFLSIAAGKAYDLGITDIVCGVCATDEAGFPDCRPGFIDAMELALRAATDTPITLHAPLLHLTKAETWKLGAELGIVDTLIDHTLTDYNGDETMNYWGRGVENNPASIHRANGYRQAKANGWIP